MCKKKSKKGHHIWSLPRTIIKKQRHLKSQTVEKSLKPKTTNWQKKTKNSLKLRTAENEIKQLEMISQLLKGTKTASKDTENCKKIPKPMS